MADLFDILLAKNLAGGVQPQGEINITANGEYDVAEYATAKVNIQGKEFNATVNVGADIVSIFAFQPTATVEIVE